MRQGEPRFNILQVILVLLFVWFLLTNCNAVILLIYEVVRSFLWIMGVPSS